jgi:protein O-GlcNAc transferase
LPNIDSLISDAVNYHRSGKFTEACDLYKKALSIDKDNTGILKLLAIALRQSGDLDSSTHFLEIALNLSPDDPGLLYESGLTLLHSGKIDGAIEHLERGVSLDKANADIHFALGNCFRLRNQFANAAEHYCKALMIKPDFLPAKFNFANTLRELGRFESALEEFEKIIASFPEMPEAHTNAALILSGLGRIAEAKEHSLKAVSIKPSIENFTFLAELYLQNSEIDQACHYFNEALKITPDHVEALLGIGNAFFCKKDLSAARDFYCKALRIRPDLADAHYGLGNVMRTWNHIDEAVICYKNALKFKPDFIHAMTNLGETYQVGGEIELAYEQFRSALSIDPYNSVANSNLLLTINYDPSNTPEQIFNAHKSWGLLVSSRQESKFNYNNNQDDSRKIRLGFVSPDFCKHPSSYFLEPVFRYLDRELFEIYCFSNTIHIDNKTEFFKNKSDHWYEIGQMDDFQAAKLVNSLGIDILIDCTGHMAANRLGIFVMKPAPVQFSGFGYPCTTGLEQIDYRIADEITEPDSDTRIYSEHLIKLKSGFCSFAPPCDAPDIGPLPANSTGYITFGSTHTLARLNQKVIELWAKVIVSVENSRLLIFRNVLSPSIISKLKGTFKIYGIEEERIQFSSDVPRQGHLQVYNSIDITLDTFPWSGHTTACESMWMGVPVITLKGDRHAGRMVSSVLSMAGFDEFICETPRQYVNTACNLASDINHLQEVRKTIREKMVTSRLCDSESFCLEISGIFRNVFENRQKDVRG